MKKTMLFMLVILFSLSAFCQEPLLYSEVIKADSISQSELYNRAKLWFSTTYVDSKSVIQMDNKEDGVIVGKAKIKYNPNYLSGSAQTEGYVNYTIKILVKDGRYKYEVSDFFHDPIGCEAGKKSFGVITTSETSPYKYFLSQTWSNKAWNDIKSQIEESISSLIPDLKKGMEKEIKMDNW